MHCAVLKLKGVISGMIVQKLFVDVKFAPSRFSWGKLDTFSDFLATIRWDIANTTWMSQHAVSLCFP